MEPSEELKALYDVPPIYAFPDDKAKPAAEILRSELAPAEADLYAEVWLISFAPGGSMLGYGFSRNQGEYLGIATVGDPGRRPRGIAYFSPQDSWELLEDRFFSEQILQLRDDKHSEPKRMPPMDGTAAYLILFKGGVVHRLFFFHPWLRRDPDETLIADALSYLMRNADLESGDTLESKWLGR